MMEIPLLRWLRTMSSVFVLLLLPVLGQKLMVCYYGSESQYRPYPGRFIPTNIDHSLCTHILFAFVDVKNNQFTPQNWNDLGNTGLYSQVVRLKSQNPALKVLLAVGGWVAGYEPFERAVATEANMQEFAQNAVTYIRVAGMDGLDMDWEFPGTRDSPPEDREKFTVFMRTIYTTFQREATSSGKEKLILTLATAVGIDYIDVAYEPSEIHKYVDYMLLMTYNFHGSWDNVTAHHSSIFPGRFDLEEGRNLCQTWAVNYWLSQGVPKSKIVLGLGTYGMSFTLEDASKNGLNATVFGGGRGGRYTRQEGILAYYEICENIQRYGWNYVWISEQEVPYATWRDQWVGFDDVRSIKVKAEKVILGMGLAGAFVWSIDLDDFSGYCGSGRYPLVSAINSVIRPRNGRTIIPNDERPLPEPDYSSAECLSLGPGTHPDPTNCRWYRFCVQFYNGYIQYTYRCPPGLAYDETKKLCVVSPTCL